MNTELVVFIVYLAFMIGIGLVFFFRSRGGGEKEYFLGGRKMGPWVSALSAGASDMSAWVLMGLPTAVYALGLGQIWIPVGLALGYALSWIFEAPRLRAFSIVSDDAITIPQYLTRRFRSKSYALQVTCAVIFLVAYTIYAASSIKAAGKMFQTVIPSLDPSVAMYVAAGIIICYTFLGGFSAVCWTDFFQGLLMLGALLIAPIFASNMLNAESTKAIAEETPQFFNVFTSWQDIVSGLGWGLGYFGMPHIIIRFLSVRSQKAIRKSSIIGISWTTLILIFAALVGVFGRQMLGLDPDIKKDELVFITMVRKIFPSVVSGILLSAILAASMSTADSQLLSAASAFSSDVYKPLVRSNKASDREMLWTGRMVVLIIAVVALVIASNPNAGSIMSLVSNAWGVFGAAFGPVILLSLFWKRLNFAGAMAGIIAGAAADILWLVFLAGTGVYEIVPGFFCGLAASIVVSQCTAAPSAEVVELFEKGVSYRETEID